MPGRISWFSPIDYHFWRFFENHDIQISVKGVAANIGYDADYTGRRLRKMRDAGLLLQNDDGLYELSDLGREFLAGDLPVEEVEELDPSPDG